MPTASTIIVNFDSLNNAMKSFGTISSQVGDSTTSLVSNAAQLAESIKGEASNIYAGKLDRLIANFRQAIEKLDQEGLELKRLYDLEYTAAGMAKDIANGITDFSI